MVERFNRDYPNSLSPGIQQSTDWKKFPFSACLQEGKYTMPPAISPSQMLFDVIFVRLRIFCSADHQMPPLPAPEDYIEKNQAWGWRKYIIWLGKETA
ncbi:hypothetical protein TNCV_4135451 [Trichonephila clavipes]|nr:hypothetical protein TNCV_4135451 [Trichonephila clavipes]